MTERLRIVGLGAGGHASVVLDVLRLADLYDIVGLLDARRDLWSTTRDGVTILGDDTQLPALHADGVRGAFIGLGGSRDNGPRQRLYETARDHGFTIVDAIHPRAVVSRAAVMGAGVTIMAGACVNAGASVGHGVLINTGAIVEHHCRLGDHVHVATGARLGGDVTIGDASHIGIGAVISNGIHIGRRVVVGAGAVVIRDVPDEATVVGVPAAPSGARARDHRSGPVLRRPLGHAARRDALHRPQHPGHRARRGR